MQNQDSERNAGDAVNCRDGATNILAHQFLMAYPFGRPQVYSSFRCNETADSPPSTASGMITNTDCTAWTCVDRDPRVANLVGFHNHVAGTKLRHWYDDGQNLIAFCSRREWLDRHQ